MATEEETVWQFFYTELEIIELMIFKLGFKQKQRRITHSEIKNGNKYTQTTKTINT